MPDALMIPSSSDEAGMGVEGNVATDDESDSIGIRRTASLRGNWGGGDGRGGGGRWRGGGGGRRGGIGGRGGGGGGGG
eukprot:6967997-Pyramimonas_sp.AAC.1